jgi:hypothetical protein
MPPEGLAGALRRDAIGEVTVRLPRFLCTACNRTETGVGWPSRCRSTPELDQLQAHLSALLSYRFAAGVLQHLLPIDAGRSPETLRNHTLRIGEQLGTATADQPTPAAAAAITVSVDSTFIRSREEGERHLEVRVGNVETASGGRQMFGAVAKADTDISALIRQSFRAVGRTDNTEVAAFTDGCPGLRSILIDAGITTPPILDWFHIAMRIQHAIQTASGLPADDPGRVQAKSVIVEEVERLRWRIWNGKAKNARRSIDRVRKVMHVYKEERSHNMRSAPSHRLWHALLDVDGYLRGQSSWLVNYAKRYRADLRVGTSITEGTANYRVNRRMNSRCAGPEEVPISCSRSAARSTTERSAQGWAAGFGHMPTRTSGRPTRRDPPSLWTLPQSSRKKHCCETVEIGADSLLPTIVAPDACGMMMERRRAAVGGARMGAERKSRC